MEVKTFRDPKTARWYAAIYQNSEGKQSVIVVDSHSGWNDNPIKVDGKILYDHPERVPGYAKKLVGKAFRFMKENGYVISVAVRGDSERKGRRPNRLPQE